MIQQFAKIAFEEHQIASGSVNRGGGPLTSYDEISVEQKRIWAAVARAVMMGCAAELDRRLSTDPDPASQH